MSPLPTLQFHNTLTRSKGPFVPIDSARVRMYVCGPTVYDWAHVGNARPVVVFDVLFRLLRRVYGEDAVTYVPAGTFTLTMPTNNTTNALLRLATT